MPNHVYNVLQFSGNQLTIDAMLVAIRHDDYAGSIDFNKVITMPASLNVTAGSDTTPSLQLYLKAASPFCTTDYGVEKMTETEYDAVLSRCQKLFPTCDFLSSTELDPADSNNLKLLVAGKVYADNIIRHGSPTWHEWCCDYWGTKWNAYDCSQLEGNILSFHTAWNNAIPVVIALSEMYPSIRFEYAWADEDFGSNVGRAIILAGKMLESEIPIDCSERAFEMASEIRGESVEDHGLVYDNTLKTYVFDGYSD